MRVPVVPNASGGRIEKSVPLGNDSLTVGGKRDAVRVSASRQCEQAHDGRAHEQDAEGRNLGGVRRPVFQEQRRRIETGRADAALVFDGDTSMVSPTTGSPASSSTGVIAVRV